VRIIVEGADGTGKSTVVNYLAKKYQCDVVHLTAWGSRKIADYNDKLALDNVILDRSFLSEMVYKAADGLCPAISFTALDNLMEAVDDKGWKIIILTAPNEELKRRLRERGDEDDNIIQNINLINTLYQIYGTHYGIPIIDTSQNCYMDEIEEAIKNDFC
jgi:thymidylate kinase